MPGAAVVSCVDFIPDEVRIQEVGELASYLAEHRPPCSAVRWIDVGGLSDLVIARGVRLEDGRLREEQASVFVGHSTLLTLFVVPAGYSVLDDALTLRARHRKTKIPGGAAEPVPVDSTRPEVSEGDSR